MSSGVQMLQSLLLPFSSVDWSPMFISDYWRIPPCPPTFTLQDWNPVCSCQHYLLEYCEPRYLVTKKQYSFFNKELNHQHFFKSNIFPQTVLFPQRLSAISLLILVQPLLSPYTSTFIAFYWLFWLFKFHTNRFFFSPKVNPRAFQVLCSNIKNVLRKHSVATLKTLSCH